MSTVISDTLVGNLEDIKSETSKARSERRGHHNYKPGRLIIRNLQYDIKEKHLVQAFKKYSANNSSLVDVNVPLNLENNLNKGFGFVEFKTQDEAVKAIKDMNGKKYKGRLISVDFALAKNKYDEKIAGMQPAINPSAPEKVEESSSKTAKDEDDWEIKSLEEEYQKKQGESYKKPAKSEVSKDKKEKVPKEKENKKEKKELDKKFENDAKEGQTLFVRNIDYTANEEDLKEFFGEFGELYFVKLVKSKDNPDVHKGTAFVKFKNQEPVDQLAKLSNDYWSASKTTTSKSIMSNMESQLEFKGRRLAMFKAETKNDRTQHAKDKLTKIDKRNLDYLKFGLVTTRDFVHEGVSQTDMDTRVRLMREKQKSLKENPNLFISKKRL